MKLTNYEKAVLKCVKTSIFLFTGPNSTIGFLEALNSLKQKGLIKSDKMNLNPGYTQWSIAMVEN